MKPVYVETIYGGILIHPNGGIRVISTVTNTHIWIYAGEVERLITSWQEVNIEARLEAAARAPKRD